MLAKKQVSTEPCDISPPAIFGAMAGAMRDIEPIAKTKLNTQGQGYKFRGIDDIYASLQPIFAKHSIFCVPTVLKSNQIERTSKSGGALFYTTLKIKYTFYTIDGSFIEAITQGEAMDSSDKGSNKAMSAAQKYCFLQIFNIPTEEAKDTEDDTPEVKGGNSGSGAGTHKHGSTDKPPASGQKYDPDYLITFGKFSKPVPKKISVVPIEDLTSYANYLQSLVTHDKPLSNNAQELLHNIALRETYEAVRDPSEPPPINDDDYIGDPFK